MKEVYEKEKQIFNHVGFLIFRLLKYDSNPIV